MAWEWSHANEAYSNARDNLHAENRNFLIEAWAEIVATPMDERRGQLGLNLPAYKQAVIDAQQFANETLADAIWEFAEQHRTCDNGGHDAHVCPHGCHTVSFDDLGNATE